jgi:hypothetical protein
MASMTSRRIRLPLLALALLAGAALLLPSVPAGAQAEEGNQDLIDKGCTVQQDLLVRSWRGWNEDRGADLSWFPEEPDFVGSGLPHVGPWDYIQHVPMFWYGPGHIKAQGEVDDREVTLADIAPTQSALTGFPFDAPDGEPMTEALADVVGTEGYEPPKLIVVMIWDAAGIPVLEEHRGLWPYLESLIPTGTWYTRGFVGSSPTSTAQAHATIGTGAFPQQHGLVGHRLRVGGKVTTPWEIGPEFFILPTFADLYDKARDNRPQVGILGTVDIHFGMGSHGAFWNGGDRDVVLTRQVVNRDTIAQEGFEWNLKPGYLPYYRLAGYANDVPGFEQDKEELDRKDGQLDGKWRDNDIESLLSGFDTPARTPYQQRVMESVIEREGFGQGQETDLLFLNYKEIDYISHVWSMNSPEMADAVEYQDQALERMVGFLDETVGEGEWALVITADHGAMPDPAISGGFQISTGTVGQLLQERFDLDDDDVRVVDIVQPSAVFLNEDELAEHGSTVDDVARYLMTLTKAEVGGSGVTPPAGTEDDVAFPVVFPSRLMLEMPCLAEERARA